MHFSRFFLKRNNKQGQWLYPMSLLIAISCVSVAEATHSPDGSFHLAPEISGSWYNPDRNGEGFVVQIADAGEGSIFVVYWFTYDMGGQAYLIGAVPFADGASEVVVPMQITGGTDFGQAFDPDEVVRRDWGTVRFSFSSCNEGMAEYQSTIGFGSGILPLQRLTLPDGLSCTEQNFIPPGGMQDNEIVKEHSGSWYNPSRNGEGFALEVLVSAEDPVLLAYWYTYDNGNQAFLIGAAPFVYGDESVIVPMQITGGTGFGSDFNEEDVFRTDWGTVEFQFSSCDNGFVRYDSSIGFGSGTIDITRLTSLSTLNCIATANLASQEILRIAWDHSNPSQLLGYIVYAGSTPDTETMQEVSNIPIDQIDNPQAPSATFNAGIDLGLQHGEQVCFRVKAYLNLLSDFSEAVCTII